MENVLIVDDSKFSRKTTRILLEKLGYNVIGEAVDGLDGIEKLNELKPDLIVTDLEMPNLDGVSMVKRIREAKNDVKILVVTSMVSSQIIQEVIRHRTTIVKKPVKESIFINALKQLDR